MKTDSVIHVDLEQIIKKLNVWKIDYTVKYSGCIEEERSMKLMASSINDALDNARRRIRGMLNDFQIDAATIWGVCIIDENPWECKEKQEEAKTE